MPGLARGSIVVPCTAANALRPGGMGRVHSGVLLRVRGHSVSRQVRRGEEGMDSQPDLVQRSMITSGSVDDAKRMLDGGSERPELPGRDDDLSPGCDDILDDENSAPSHVGTLSELRCPVGLRFLADERYGQPGDQRQRRRDWDAAQFQASQHLRVRGDQAARLASYFPE